MTTTAYRELLSSSQDSQSPPSLVPDVFDALISELALPDETGFWTTDSRRDLLQASLVCRAWNARATFLLYHKIQIRTSEQAAKLVRTLNATERGFLIGELQVGSSTTAEEVDSEKTRTLASLDEQILEVVNTKCTSLMSLILEPQTSATLVSQSITHARRRFPALSTLRYVELRGICAAWFVADDPGESSRRIEEPHSLEVLQLYETTLDSLRQWRGLPSLTKLMLWSVKLETDSIIPSLLSLACSTLEHLTLGDITLKNTREHGVTQWQPLVRLRMLNVGLIALYDGSIAENVVSGLIRSTPSTLESLSFDMDMPSDLEWPNYERLASLSVSESMSDATARLFVQVAEAQTLQQLTIFAGPQGSPWLIVAYIQPVCSTLKSFSLHAFLYSSNELGTELIQRMSSLETIELPLLRLLDLAEWIISDLTLPPDLHTIQFRGVIRSKSTILELLRFIESDPQHRLRRLRILRLLQNHRADSEGRRRIEGQLSGECVKRGFVLQFEMDE